jgi:hypothetical protein
MEHLNMTTTGKLELTIKINEFPEPQTIENGWKQFDLDCEGQLVRVKVKPKEPKPEAAAV